MSNEALSLKEQRKIVRESNKKVIHGAIKELLDREWSEGVALSVSLQGLVFNEGAEQVSSTTELELQLAIEASGEESIGRWKTICSIVKRDSGDEDVIGSYTVTFFKPTPFIVAERIKALADNGKVLRCYGYVEVKQDFESNGFGRALTTMGSEIRHKLISSLGLDSADVIFSLTTDDAKGNRGGSSAPENKERAGWSSYGKSSEHNPAEYISVKSLERIKSPLFVQVLKDVYADPPIPYDQGLPQPQALAAD